MWCYARPCAPARHFLRFRVNGPLRSLGLVSVAAGCACVPAAASQSLPEWHRAIAGPPVRRTIARKEDTVPIYKAPVDQMMFLLSDVFQIARYNNLPGFAEASADLIETILSEAAKLCEEVVQPLNRVGDEEGCTRHPDGSVT